MLQGKSINEVREMASLTKIMTAITSIELAEELKLHLHKTYFKVSAKASGTIGTTANLIEHQMVSIYDLLYGLMLPSGNDSGMTLAENFSKYILKEKIKRKPALAKEPVKSTISMFVKKMNNMSFKLHLK